MYVGHIIMYLHGEEGLKVGHHVHWSLESSDVPQLQSVVTFNKDKSTLHHVVN